MSESLLEGFKSEVTDDTVGSSEQGGLLSFLSTKYPSRSEGFFVPSSRRARGVRTWNEFKSGLPSIRGPFC